MKNRPIDLPKHNCEFDIVFFSQISFHQRSYCSASFQSFMGFGSPFFQLNCERLIVFVRPIDSPTDVGHNKSELAALSEIIDGRIKLKCNRDLLPRLQEDKLQRRSR